jgi:hypothetical protein
VFEAIGDREVPARVEVARNYVEVGVVGERVVEVREIGVDCPASVFPSRLSTNCGCSVIAPCPRLSFLLAVGVVEVEFVGPTRVVIEHAI